MSIRSIHWRSAEREAVVGQYKVYTGDQPNGRMLYVNTNYTLEISRTGGCCMSIHSIHCRSAEREAVVCQYKVLTGDQPNGRLLYVNTQ